MTLGQLVWNSDKPGVIGDAVKLHVGYGGNATATLIADGMNFFGSAYSEAFQIRGPGGGMRVCGRGYHNLKNGRGDESGSFFVDYSAALTSFFLWTGTVLTKQAVGRVYSGEHTSATTARSKVGEYPVYDTDGVTLLGYVDLKS